MYFGRILRDNKKTLKQLNVKDRTSIVVQVLDEPEVLEPDTYVLLFSQRDVANQTYINQREVRFKGTKLSELRDKAREVFEVQDNEEVEIAKHVPHAFEWKWLQEDEIVSEKRKKNKTVEIRVGDQDLKKFPILLKDGDQIGVRI